MAEDLSVVQKTYDLILWFVPIVNKFPKDHKFTLGDRLTNNLYDLLDGLLTARYRKRKLELLEELNGRLDVIRHQVRLCLDLKLMDGKRFQHASGRLLEIGKELGGWIRQQRARAGE